VQIAKDQANDTIALVQRLIESVGWEFETEHRKISAAKAKQLLKD
jgi:hypothetical protein